MRLFFEETSTSYIIAWLLSNKLLQINYYDYTLILNIYVLILFGRDYTISELFGFFHRLMLALLPICLSNKIFLDAYQFFLEMIYKDNIILATIPTLILMRNPTVPPMVLFVPLCWWRVQVLTLKLHFQLIQLWDKRL